VQQMPRLLGLLVPVLLTQQALWEQTAAEVQQSAGTAKPLLPAKASTTVARAAVGAMAHGLELLLLGFGQP
jgi:hypothetical protein